MRYQDTSRLADSQHRREYLLGLPGSTISVQTVAMAASIKKNASQVSAEPVGRLTRQVHARSCGRGSRMLKEDASAPARRNATRLRYLQCPGRRLRSRPRKRQTLFSPSCFTRGTSLCSSLQGVGLPDPERLLQGDGKVVRHIKLESPADLDKPAIRKLMAVALKSAKQPIDSAASGGLIIRSIAKKQRPRRPDKSGAAPRSARAPS